jgi:predicted ATPase/class 3 adenylate cyclase
MRIFTFLFTDIEGSTRHWEEHPEAMRAALAGHDAAVRGAVRAHNGSVFKTIGDAFCAAFIHPCDAVFAALDAQRALQAKWEGAPPRSGGPGPLLVRMAVHTGEAEERDDDYFGPALSRTARLLVAGHGGQVLVSQSTASLLQGNLPDSITLRDLGSHRLRDLARSEAIYQLLHPALPAQFPPLRSLAAFAHNLPLQLTSFIGREQEIAEVKRLLGATRLLTLTGAGGVGKTRLALQVGADQMDEYPDGVWLVELASLSDPAFVPQTVASALGVREEPNRPVLDTLADHLRHKRLLLILDNCEHVVASCALLAEGLLRSCSDLRLMVTSQQALSILAETTWRVPSLSLPDPSRLSLEPAVALARFEASRLFMDRARSVLPTFAVTGENGSAIGQICRRLDGIPLAIELAAARVRVLSAREIAARLDDRFRLLTGGSRTAMPQQQTLRAAIDWSYDLLSELERALMLRLSVFAGGWSLEAAEEICAGDGIEPWEVLDLFSQLVDKSLVTVEDLGGQTRYRLLESVKQYSWERLCATGRADAVRDRHLQLFLRLAEEADPNLWRIEQARWLERLETEHDNLRSALDWSAQASSAAAELRLAGAMGGFWHIRGHLSEGSERLAHALSRSEGERGDSAADPGPAFQTADEARGRARVLIWAGVLAWFQADLVRTTERCEASLALARQIGDRWLVARSLIILGYTAYSRGNLDRSAAVLSEALAISRQTGDEFLIRLALAHMGFVALFRGEPESVPALCEESLSLSRVSGDNWNQGLTLLVLGLYHQYYQHDAEQAAVCYSKALSLYERLGDTWMVSLSQNLLGLASQHQGDLARAAALHREGLTTCRILGDKQGIAISLGGLAALVGMQGQPVRAVRLLGAAAALREAIGVPLPPFLRPDQQRGIAALRTGLGEEIFAAVWAQGQALTLEQAVHEALDL